MCFLIVSCFAYFSSVFVGFVILVLSTVAWFISVQSIFWVSLLFQVGVFVAMFPVLSAARCVVCDNVVFFVSLPLWGLRVPNVQFVKWKKHLISGADQILKVTGQGRSDVMSIPFLRGEYIRNPWRKFYKICAVGRKDELMKMKCRHLLTKGQRSK